MCVYILGAINVSLLYWGLSDLYEFKLVELKGANGPYNTSVSECRPACRKGGGGGGQGFKFYQVVNKE